MTIRRLVRSSRIRSSVIAVALVACADASRSSLPTSPTLSLGIAGHRVIGSGHVEQAAGLREFTYHALQDEFGAATGSYKIVLPNGLFFEADVTCLSVSGNTGWVGGVIRATNAAAVVVGSTSTFYAIDNGEGGNAADIVSTATFNGAAGADQAFCTDQPLALAPFTVTGGNVQVR